MAFLRSKYARVPCRVTGDTGKGVAARELDMVSRNVPGRRCCPALLNLLREAMAAEKRAVARLRTMLLDVDKMEECAREYVNPTTPKFPAYVSLLRFSRAAFFGLRRERDLAQGNSVSSTNYSRTPEK